MIVLNTCEKKLYVAVTKVPLGPVVIDGLSVFPHPDIAQAVGRINNDDGNAWRAAA